MKTNKLVLAVSLALVSSVASAASLVATFTPSAGMGDAIILQTQVASGVQLGVSVQTGIACASLGSSPISPVASVDISSFAGLPVITPTTTVTSVDPHVSVYGTGTASALVTQDALGLVVVPTSAINSIALIAGASGPF
jgi:hypothetical protein